MRKYQRAECKLKMAYLHLQLQLQMISKWWITKFLNFAWMVPNFMDKNTGEHESYPDHLFIYTTLTIINS